MKEEGKSIRSKLIKLILIISSLSLLVAFAVLFAYELFSYKRATDRELHIMANMLAQNSTAALAFNNTQEAEDILSSLKANPEILSAALYDNDGKAFAQIEVKEGTERLPDLLPANLVNNSSAYLEVVVPVVQEEKILGSLYIRRSTEDVKARIALYLLLVLAVMGFCFALTYALSKTFEKSISDPIISLAKIAKTISEKHDYSVRAHDGQEGEIKTLTVAFNQMLSRIEAQNKDIQQHALQLEQKVADRTYEIKRQRDFAETVLNSSLVLIASFDADTRFTSFNKRCEIEFGCTREDVLGKRLADVMPAVVGSPAYKAVIRSLNGELAHYEKYRSAVTGEYYEAFGVPLLNEKNEVYGALLTAHNITATVTANEKLVRTNEELKKKNAELEQFAYVASHDLQEPLRKIQIYADMGRNLLGAQHSTMKFLEKIESSAKRMSMLIKDVLEYSKLARVEESYIDTDLNHILENVKLDFELLIAEKGASIESTRLPMVYGNPLHLHQLFANLVNNSLKFNEQAPQIRLSAAPASKNELEGHVTVDSTRQYIKLTFSDNGIGFDPMFKDKIFTIFQRLNTREKYEGTGIGLALCKKIVENHHGHISVDSTPGKGTTFTIILPKA